MGKRKILTVLAALVISTCLILILAVLGTSQEVKKEAYELKVPLGLDDTELRIPEDNPLTNEKIELGKLLFFDKRLSVDGIVACANCHNPKFGFTDGEPVSTGVGGQKGGRSAPTAINRAFSTLQFWDGRAPSLEEQAKGPMVNPIEMANPSHDAVVERLKKIKGYRELFKNAFGTEDLTIEHGVKAIASFERTVLSGNSAFDKFESGGDTLALSESAKRGLELFREKARCTQCHAGFNFTDEKFHNIGVGMDKPRPDLGRYNVTKDEKDKGAFKTPTVREIASTAPYMHDGGFKTLEEVVDFYDKGGTPNPNLDKEIKELKLSAEEKKDLVEFLKSLSGEGWQVTPPEKFPE